jgi:hypothetical protein
MSTVASPEWIAVLAHELKEHAEVRDDARTWTHGPIALIIDADEARSHPGGRVVLEFGNGVVDAGVEPALTPFAFSGSLDRWQAIFSGSETMMDAALQSKLHVRGDLPTLQRHRGLLDAVAKTAGGLETVWPEAPAKV